MTKSVQSLNVEALKLIKSDCKSLADTMRYKHLDLLDIAHMMNMDYNTLDSVLKGEKVPSFYLYKKLHLVICGNFFK